jgi:hypothetical protein
MEVVVDYFNALFCICLERLSKNAKTSVTIPQTKN